MIVASVLYAAGLLWMTERIPVHQKFISYSWIYTKIPSSIILLMCPIIGILSGSYFGRYKFLRASLYLWLIAVIFVALDLISSSRFVYLNLLGCVAMSLSIAFYAPCAIPFTIDQLVGASGEELSFTVYWIIWTFTVWFGLQNLLRFCLQLNNQTMDVFWVLLSSSSFVIVYVMNECFSQVLMTKPQLSSPLKLVAKVLNYARRHRFPERRSAFTYWEDECPTRLDLGKDKYGGPFTVEEVEDVKTILKLVPLITCIAPSLAFYLWVDVPIAVQSYCSTTLRPYLNLVQSVVMISWAPIYHFIIYPFFYNRVPTMLKRIGFGLFLMALSHLINSTYELLVTTIPVQKSAANVTSNTVTAPYEEFVIVFECFLSLTKLVFEFGKVIVALTTLEFCMAQAPCHVRGLISSFLMASCGFFAGLNSFLDDKIKYNPFVDTFLSVVMLVLFAVFVLLSKWYKLRKRDDVIPYHMFAEDQFESDCRQEKAWRRERGYPEKWFCTTADSQHTATGY